MAAASPTQHSFAKTRGHHAPYTGTEESRYHTKCKDLKRKIVDVEGENDILALKIDRAKRSIARMRLERALLQEKLEEKTPAHVEDSEGSESESSIEQGKPVRAQLSGSRRRSSDAGTSYSTVSESSPPPPTYHPPSRMAHNPRLHLVMQNPTHAKGGRRGTPKGSRGRPSPAPKPPRDPNAPKRPTNPFLRFCEQERDNVRALHGSDENFDLTKAMGVAWHELDDQAKIPYKHAFNEDQKRYKEDMVVYEQMKARSERLAVPKSHRPVTSSSRIEESASYYDDEEEVDEEVGSEAEEEGLANLTGREGSVDAMDLGETASNADLGTEGGSTPGRGGFTAVNRRTGGLDGSMFKQED